MTGFRILKTGPQASVQDGGRAGLMRYGLPASGAMDRGALAIANAALGNAADAPVLEVSPMGLEIVMAVDCSVAVAGGGFILETGIPETTVGRRPAWAVLGLRAGEGLRLRPGHWGNWCALAFAGGVAARRFAGSAATHAGSGLGGGVLAAGQDWALAAPDWRAARHGAIACPVWARPRAVFDILPGPQAQYFTAEDLARLVEAPFTVTTAMDRMGVRLNGPALVPQGALGIASAPVARGSLQVSGGGEVTVLMADHQTTGGYPRIATLADLDADAFAQCRPGTQLRFRAVTAEAALARHRAETARRAGWLMRLRG